MERVTDEQTDKDEEHAEADEPDEALDPYVLPMKGADMEWVTEQVARDLLRFGIHGDGILKSDQEPAIVDVLKEISKLLSSRRTMIEAFPVGDSKSNGVAEAAVQSMEKLIGVHKLPIETRIKDKLSVTHCLHGWWSFARTCTTGFWLDPMARQSDSD